MVKFAGLWDLAGLPEAVGQAKHLKLFRDAAGKLWWGLTHIFYCMLPGTPTGSPYDFVVNRKTKWTQVLQLCQKQIDQEHFEAIGRCISVNNQWILLLR